jgi:ferritin heavy chain
MGKGGPHPAASFRPFRPPACATCLLARELPPDVAHPQKRLRCSQRAPAPRPPLSTAPPTLHLFSLLYYSDDVALKGFASHFAEESLEERGHAQKLMDFQTLRGGRVKLQSILAPEMEFGGAVAGAKGEALYAMELALSLEKLNFHKLRALHSVADAAGDANMADFVEGQLLADQAASVQTVSEYVTQLRRVGKGLGVFEFDKKLAG